MDDVASGLHALPAATRAGSTAACPSTPAAPQQLHVRGAALAQPRRHRGAQRAQAAHDDDIARKVSADGNVGGTARHQSAFHAHVATVGTKGGRGRASTQDAAAPRIRSGNIRKQRMRPLLSVCLYEAVDCRLCSHDSPLRALRGQAGSHVPCDRTGNHTSCSVGMQQHCESSKKRVQSHPRF